MTPARRTGSDATAAATNGGHEGGRGSGSVVEGRSLPAEDRDDDVDVASAAISKMVSERMKSFEEKMESANLSLYDDFEAMKEDVKALLHQSCNEGGASLAGDDSSEAAAGSPGPAKKMRKKSKAKKKGRGSKRGEGKGTSNVVGGRWGAVRTRLARIAAGAPAAKIAAGLACVALLASAALGQQGIAGGKYVTLQDHGSAKDLDGRNSVVKDLASETPAKVTKRVDWKVGSEGSQAEDISTREDQAGEDGAGNFVPLVKKKMVDKSGRGGDSSPIPHKKWKGPQQAFREKLQAMLNNAAPLGGETSHGIVKRTLQDSTTSASFYPVPDGYCDNDPSNRPGNDDGINFYENPEECCKEEFSAPGAEFMTFLCIADSPPRPPQTQDEDDSIPENSSAAQSQAVTSPPPSEASQSPASIFDDAVPEIPSAPPSEEGSSNPPITTSPSKSPASVFDDAAPFVPSAAPSQAVTPAAAEATDQPSAAASDGISGTSLISTYQPTTDSPTHWSLSTSTACNADPETCGCPDLLLADYRGYINVTIGGLACKNWDEFPDFSGDGLEGNFCRNPDDNTIGPWCFTGESIDGTAEIGYCDVPMCPNAQCNAADKTTCGCKVENKNDYRGQLNTTNEGEECLRWDSELVALDFFGDPLQDYPDAGLEENFCRNPEQGSYGSYCYILGSSGVDYGYCDVPSCDPCSCMPPCGEPNDAACGCPSVLQAEACCDEEGPSCKCNYLKDACRKSLETNNTFFCDMAEAECCKDKGDPSCRCSMFEQICSDFPSQSTCDVAAHNCCGDENYLKQGCLCDFYTYTSTVLDVGSKGQEENCEFADSCLKIVATTSYERDYSLHALYDSLGGPYWFENEGWFVEEEDHCMWFGLSCDERGFITSIDLPGNNLTGPMSFGNLLIFSELATLNLAGNELSGTVSSDFASLFPNLEEMDISQNNFDGHLDMLFPPTTFYVNLSHNNFTSAGFKRFNPAYEWLEVIDLSNNIIGQEASDIFLNVPPNLYQLFLSNNSLRGSLPNPFPTLNSLEVLSMDGNDMSGPLPDFLTATPKIRELDLSNQERSEEGGFEGSIPDSIWKLPELVELNLANNKLSEGIPSAIGNLDNILILNLSSNLLSQSIPPQLGKLEVLDILDLSDNRFTGKIPSELADLNGASIHLSGNANLSNPAPLTLCNDGFDMTNDTMLCPPERAALKEIYDSSKGNEWTASVSWLDEYKSHCSWYGVTCDATGSAVRLGLQNNGLSGTLSEKIGDLSSLEHVDLSDNDIKGAIPTSIARLSDLTYLRLSYNDFTGDETNLTGLQQLTLIQLNGNRLKGTLPPLNNLHFSDQNSYVSDCGNPSDFDQSLLCEECTMCCNAQGDCYPNKEMEVMGVTTYLHLSGVFFAFVFLACVALVIVVLAYDKYRTNRHLSRELLRRQSIQLSSRDTKYALETIGDDSVYRFFLGWSAAGWTIVMFTVAVQLYLLFVFVKGAEINVADDKVDFVYTFKCPRDADECEDKSDLDAQGWVSYIILMAAHLLKDIISGLKLLVLSAKQRHDFNTRTRYFFGGLLLISVTAFTLYVSTIYNMAIATSNTEIIVNSVIILFIIEIDEYFFGIIEAINPNGVERMSLAVEGDESVIETNQQAKSDDEVDQDVGPQLDVGAGDANFEEKVASLESRIETLDQSMKLLLKENAELKILVGKPQDGRLA